MCFVPDLACVFACGAGCGEQAVKWSGSGGEKQRLMAQLQVFRFPMGAFSRSTDAGDYTMSDRVCSWATYGYCAADLKLVALALTPLSCGSGCAERNWTACKSVLNKRRNRLGKDQLERIVFVWTWSRLQHALKDKLR